MKLIDIIFETVDFFHEFQDKNPCEFSDSLPSNRGKLYKLITDYTITRLDLNFRRENGLETETNFRNAFFKKIPEEFVIIIIIIIVVYSHSKGTEWLRQLVKYSAQAS